MGIDFDSQSGDTSIDPQEARGLIPSITTKQELNEFEGQNIEAAIAWSGSSRQIKTDILSEKTLKLLHKRMFDKTWKWAGEFRKTEKNIGIAWHRIPVDLRTLLDDVKAWIEYTTYPPDEIAARFHHRLVAIHLFPNGNGRHARLATDLLCESQGWPPFTWGSANLVRPESTREEYIRALQSADAHEYEPLIAFCRS